MPTQPVTTVISSQPRQVNSFASSQSVTSAYGRVGDVVGEEGDYSLGQMTDVEIAITPTAENLLEWNGISWVPTSQVDGGTYQ